MYYACNYMKQNVYFYLVGIYIVQWIVYLEIINIKYYFKNKTIKSSFVFLGWETWNISCWKLFKTSLTWTQKYSESELKF